MGIASSACCLGETACCLGTSALSCCGRAIQCDGSVGYPSIVFLGTTLSILFRYFLIDHLSEVLKHAGSSSMCSQVEDADAKSGCYGNQFVYRLGFSMVLFFTLMSLLVTCFKKMVHDGAWCLKIGLILTTFIASLWIDDDSMAGFATACLCGSAIFIVINVLILLEWVYAWNESWVALAQEDETYFQYLAGSALLSYVLSAVFIILCCVQFAASGCDFAVAQITWTCIACFLFSLLSISGIADYGSLLCSALVTLYCSYYCWSALSGMAPDTKNDDGNRCNTLLGEDGSIATTVNVIFGLVLTAISLAWVAYSTSSGDIGTGSNHTGTSHSQDGEKDEEDGQTAYKKMDSTDNSDTWDEPAQPLVAYHVIMILCTMFMVMTVCNWDIDVTAKKAKMENFGTGNEVVWVKTLSQWLTIALYTWTLVAPRVLAACGCERDFDFT